MVVETTKEEFSAKPFQKKTLFYQFLCSLIDVNC